MQVAVLAQPVGVPGRVPLAVPAHEREHVGVVVLRRDQPEPLDQADAGEVSPAAVRGRQPAQVGGHDLWQPGGGRGRPDVGGCSYDGLREGPPDGPPAVPGPLPLVVVRRGPDRVAVLAQQPEDPLARHVAQGANAGSSVIRVLPVGALA